MTDNILKLYPQYTRGPDRRQQNIPVAVERRSGIDRRFQTRSPIDPKLSRDIVEIKNTFSPFIKDGFKSTHTNSGIKGDNVFLKGALSVLPGLRRITPIKENTEDDNPVKTVGQIGIAVINLKEDYRDILSLAGKTTTAAPKGYYSRFKFFAGTSMERWLLKSELGRKIFKDIDITLADTSLGYKILDKLKIKHHVELFEKEINYLFSHKQETVYREYVKLSGSLLRKTAGLTLNRITIIGAALSGILELPTIIKSIKNDNNYKQISKSAVNVCSVIICGAVISSILALTIGGIGSVLGLSAGLFIGNKLANYINNTQ